MSRANFCLAFRSSYYLIRPWVAIAETQRNLKWVLQRGLRGYADCDVWGLDSYLAGWLPEALERLQANKLGYPCGMTRKGWDSRLERMKDGFLTAREIHEMNYTNEKECQILTKRTKKGLNVFVEHFFSLWD